MEVKWLKIHFFYPKMGTSTNFLSEASFFEKDLPKSSNLVVQNLCYFVIYEGRTYENFINKKSWSLYLFGIFQQTWTDFGCISKSYLSRQNLKNPERFLKACSKFQ